jgi:hypothetical protein
MSNHDPYSDFVMACLCLRLWRICPYHGTDNTELFNMVLFRME